MVKPFCHSNVFTERHSDKKNVNIFSQCILSCLFTHASIIQICHPIAKFTSTLCVQLLDKVDKGDLFYHIKIMQAWSFKKKKNRIQTERFFLAKVTCVATYYNS